MNANEVISNRAIELAGGVQGSKDPIHPNDDVNMSQSSNDTFPTAMHIAAVEELTHRLLPAFAISATHWRPSRPHSPISPRSGDPPDGCRAVDVGPGVLGLRGPARRRSEAYGAFLGRPLRAGCGGTAVGTGLNTHPDSAIGWPRRIAEITGLPFVSAPNKFAALAAHDAFVSASGVLRTLAVSLIKIADDIRWLGSGPRSGLGELVCPRTSRDRPSCRGRSTRPRARR